ncbi:hypothetical protein WICPIJ_009040 [Wickerhamomyces pijperi]|uniref:Uncharacterized protein n=1 Tax=Wickerhamomyces pijperi TaxID=599730 RepID=A0A9P8PST2_WICPI|nr:hypothetical protein WICPIJ_009040 [Wickerhamomyces pijperi]
MLPYENAAIKITTPDFIDASRHLFINIHSFFPDQSKGILNANYNIRDIIQPNGFSAEAISIPQLNTLRNDWPNNTTKRFVLNSVNLDAAALSDLQNFEEKDCSYVGCDLSKMSSNLLSILTQFLTLSRSS